MQNFNIASSEETYTLGKKLGELLQPSMVICLSGDLGAGKTHFTKGIATGLGIDDYITSPTYTLINEYPGEKPLYHFDVYRLEGSDELNELGYQEYFYGKGVTVIEWADIIMEALPKERLWVVIHKLDGDHRRVIMDPMGTEYEKLVEELMNDNEIKPMVAKGGMKNENTGC